MRLQGVLDNMCLRVLVGILCLLSHSIGYSRILIRADKTSFVEFSAYAQTESVKTFSQYQLEKIRVSSRPVRLKSLLEKAQSEFLSHNPDEAKPIYQSIVHQSHSFDWNEEERKIIFYSFLRLAQLEKDVHKSKLLLKEAVIFEQDLELVFSIFPPPLVKSYREIKKASLLSSLDLITIFPSHEKVLINGKMYKNTQKLLLPYGTYRVTALSSSHELWSKVISLSQLVLKKIQTLPLVTGGCQEAALSRIATKNETKYKFYVLFPNFCLWNSHKNIVLEPKPVDIQKIMNEKQSEQTVVLGKWFWFSMAATVLVTSFFIIDFEEERSNSSSDSPRSKPMVSVGF